MHMQTCSGQGVQEGGASAQLRLHYPPPLPSGRHVRTGLRAFRKERPRRVPSNPGARFIHNGLTLSILLAWIASPFSSTSSMALQPSSPWRLFCARGFMCQHRLPHLLCRPRLSPAWHFRRRLLCPMVDYLDISTKG